MRRSGCDGTGLAVSRKCLILFSFVVVVGVKCLILLSYFEKPCLSIHAHAPANISSENMGKYSNIVVCCL